MTEPINLAFLWHQHQPYYLDSLTGRIEMPWVRLHGIKDYFGMAAMIDQFEEIKATINFVPSLLVQLIDQANGKEDVCQTLTRIPAENLTLDQRKFLLSNFFLVNPDTMIRPFPRFFELFNRRGGADVTDRVAARFSNDDYLDIQVLSNLSWIHPISISEDPFLAELMAKRRGFSEEEKLLLLDKQEEILRQVIPLHKKMQEEGKIELSTTPFYHPIVPLLIDETSAHEAMPGVRLPKRTLTLASDAMKQITRAYEYHTSVFGLPPKGMWPSEGSVSQEAAELFASAGCKWIATDQEILARSNSVISDEDRHPYQSYWMRGVTGKLAIVFRDHTISDLLSFQYQYFTIEDAVNDFIARIRSIATKYPQRPACVFVILDGENAWEHYTQTGYPFFNLLYSRLQEADDIRMTTVGDYIEQSKSEHSLDRLAAGSWINGDFAIWAGHAEDVEAWEYIDRVREDLRALTQKNIGKYSQEQLGKAWEEIYIAEGSDYFWWYGEDHSSVQDMEFDALFRLHLKNVYRHLGERYPDFLNQPIKKKSTKQLYSLPTALLNVKIDGKVSSYFEWRFAARYDGSADYGSMARVARTKLQDVYFGFDTENLLLRIDISQKDAEHSELSAVVVIRKPVSLKLEYPISFDNEVLVCKDSGKHYGKARYHKILEIAVPLLDLNASVGDVVEFQIVLEEGGKILEILPRGGVFSDRVPPGDFDQKNWGL